MATEIRMPQFGVSMETGTVAQWLKAEGDTVKAGDVLASIETEKLTNDVVSEVDGVLLKIVAQEGEDIPVQGLMAYIGQPGEALPDGSGTTAPAAAAPAPAPAAAAPAPTAAAAELMDGDTVEKLSGMRKVVAQRMQQSHTEIPPVTQVTKVDVTALMQFRRELLERRERSTLSMT